MNVYLVLLQPFQISNLTMEVIAQKKEPCDAFGKDGDVREVKQSGSCLIRVFLSGNLNEICYRLRLFFQKIRVEMIEIDLRINLLL